MWVGITSGSRRPWTALPGFRMGARRFTLVVISMKLLTGENYMCISLNEITWQAIAAIATFIAVIVALIPIWREAKRQKAHARSLRFRLCSKLALLRPSLHTVVNGGHSNHPAAILSKEKFREEVDYIDTMLRESSVLKAGEQDSLHKAFANIHMAAELYNTPDLTGESAGFTLSLIDKAISVMEKRGLLHREVEVP